MEHPAFTLGALLATGGIFGYTHKGSVASLVAGVAVGGLYGTAGYLLKDNKEYGLETAIAASALLLAGVVPRAIKTKLPLPISLSVVGLTSLVYYGYKWKEFNL